MARKCVSIKQTFHTYKVSLEVELAGLKLSELVADVCPPPPLTSSADKLTWENSYGPLKQPGPSLDTTWLQLHKQPTLWSKDMAKRYHLFISIAHPWHGYSSSCLLAGMSGVLSW